MVLRRNVSVGGKHKHRRGGAAWTVIVGVFLALVSGFITYYAAVTWQNADASTATYASLLITLLVALLTVQLELFAATKEAVERSREQAELWQKLEQSPDIREQIVDMIDCAAAIDAMVDNSVYVERAREDLAEWSEELRELARTRIRPTPDLFQEVVMPLAEIVLDKKVEHCIRAVAVRNPLGTFEWWESTAGKAYWEFNKKALAKGVPIERIFVYEAEGNELPDALKKLAEEQCKAGVKVYTAKSERIRPDLKIDTAVFDEAFEFELQVSHDGEPQQYFCSRSPLDISRRLRGFKRIKAQADLFCEPQHEQRPLWRRIFGS